MAMDFWALGIVGVVVFLIILAVAILSFVFWVAMLIDCLKKKFKNDNDRIIWVLVIIFTGLLGATIYYFVVKKK
jgi:hypothetical protein